MASEVLPSDEGTLKEVISILGDIRDGQKIPIMIPITEDTLPNDIQWADVIAPYQAYSLMLNSDPWNQIQFQWMTDRNDQSLTVQMIVNSVVVWRRKLVPGNFKFGIGRN